MNAQYPFLVGFRIVTITLTLLIGSSASWAQQAPPELGQETKGKPAMDETLTTQIELDSSSSSASANGEQGTEKLSGIDSLLGKAQITESKRENGQVYLIELEHSSGTKQYIEENDSDGKIQSTSNDIEETPNLPKWKLGSW